jgi:C-terminal peptidase prc
MLMRSRTLIALFAGAVFGFSGAIAGDVQAERRSDEAMQAPPALPWEQARLFAEVYERIKREYVDEVDDKQLMEKAIRGMVAALDPHSAFLDNDEFEEIRLSTMGSYPGVGIEVVAEDSAVKVLRPIEGSPADQAGMQSGDLIVKIDDKDVGADLAGAITQMRGPAGSVVRLTVRRPTTGELLDFSLRRAKVDVRSVMQTTLEPGFGYVRITSFSETTADDVARAVAQIKRDNPKGVTGLVLDLRNNPGGVLEAGVAVADAFLNEGVIVTADGRTADARFRMEATPGDLIDGAELVVLVNGLGFGGGNRRWRAERSQPRGADRTQDVRQRLRANGDAVVPRWCDQADDVALLHAVRSLDPRQRHQSGHRRRGPRSGAGRAARDRHRQAESAARRARQGSTARARHAEVARAVPGPRRPHRSARRPSVNSAVAAAGRPRVCGAVIHFA